MVTAQRKIKKRRERKEKSQRARFGPRLQGGPRQYDAYNLRHIRNREKEKEKHRAGGERKGKFKNGAAKNSST